MQLRSFVIMLGTSLCFSVVAFIQPCTAHPIPKQSKVYIEPSQIHVLQEGLFIEIVGNLYQVSQICQDENGFFYSRC